MFLVASELFILNIFYFILKPLVSCFYNATINRKFKKKNGYFLNLNGLNSKPLQISHKLAFKAILETAMNRLII